MKMFLTVIAILLPTIGLAQVGPSPSPESNQATFDFKSGDSPTIVEADNLTLFSDQRKFVYSGNVKVTRDDLTLTSKNLEGYYDQNNKIQRLIAKDDVQILKGPTINAHGQQAVYDESLRTVVLTGSPDISQNESLLTADKITIFIDENRSTADGNVRVKVIQNKPTPPPSPTSTPIPSPSAPSKIKRGKK